MPRNDFHSRVALDITEGTLVSEGYLGDRPHYTDESERISIMARSHRLHSRPNTLAQTDCH
jgi:hypothetical protein